MARLFSALTVPDPVRAKLGSYFSGLPGARWMDEEDLHITLAFFGDIDGEKSSAIQRQLSSLKARAFDITVTGFDYFGGSRPRALIVRVGQNTPLLKLAQQNKRAARDAEVTRRWQKYSPHITLARLKKTPVASIIDWIGHRGPFTPTVWTVNEFVLMRSKDFVGGGPYVIDDKISLA